ncbi:MAG: DUF3352 domain-containing protein [Cytophagales bacterium]|nr:MAG: DUF3352 domain-containing protein [Cytophagales bacterium]TAF61455.1 MAG: DUF3352 domain-containing protein [Cytophagales bacterium]
MIRKLIIVVAVLLAIGAGAATFFLYSGGAFGKIEPMHMVPNDAIYVIETQAPLKSWRQWASGLVWNHLKKQSFFAEMGESVEALNKVIKENSLLLDILGEHSVIISAHKYAYKDYDFLYVVDLGDKGNLTAAFQDYLNPIIRDAFQTGERTVGEYRVLELFDPADRSTLHVVFIDNLVICSYVGKLVDAAINQRNSRNFAQNDIFLAVKEKTSIDGMGRLYLNYNLLDEFANCYMSKPDENIQKLSESLFFSAFDLELDDKKGLIEMRGFTNVNPSYPSYFRALLQSGNGQISAPLVIPAYSSFFFSLTFDNFNLFLDNLENVMQEEDEEGYQEYIKNTSMIENFLNIDIREDFASWVKDEIAVAQVETNRPNSKDEFALFIKASNVEDARSKLDHITNQVRKRSPVKFKSFSYKNYQISFLAVKGLFKILLGKYFDKIEKPYFTIIKDYVVFSNNPQTLKSIIDDFENKLTLADDESFQNFFDNFDNNSNFFSYVSMPVMNQNLASLVDASTLTNLKQNEDYMLCFPHFGIQLVKEDTLFDTKIISAFAKPDDVRRTFNNFMSRRSQVQSQDPTQSNTVDKIFDMFDGDGQNTAEGEDDLLTEVFTDVSEMVDVNGLRGVFPRKTTKVEGNRKIVAFYKDKELHGAYKEYENNILRIKGRYRNNLKDGTWYLYDETGELIDKIRYKKGKEN